MLLYRSHFWVLVSLVRLLFCPHSWQREPWVETLFPQNLVGRALLSVMRPVWFFSLPSPIWQNELVHHVLLSFVPQLHWACSLNMSSFYLPTCFLFLDFSSPTPLLAFSLIKSELKCQLSERPFLANLAKLQSTIYAKKFVELIRNN